MNHRQECLILGRANVGKTLFLLNFAEYLGCRDLSLESRLPAGDVRQERLSLTVARNRLVSAEPHETRRLQALDLHLPRGKGKKRFRLTDSTGLSDEIHRQSDVRIAMAQTLRVLRQAGVVIHMLDAAAIGPPGGGERVGEIDRQIAQYAPLRAAYAMCANKMDLPGAPAGLRKIREAFVHQVVLPISALKRTGFQEVKSHVWDHI